MALYTSDRFASAAASGTDWRDTARSVLEMIESVTTDKSAYNIGFLYLTDHLTEDAESILALFREVTQIENWVGCTGVAVCATGEDFIDEPAISAMVGRFDDDSFCFFPAVDFDIEPAREALEPWTERAEPMLVVVHGDQPAQQEMLAPMLVDIARMTGGFLAGGLASSRNKRIHIASDLYEDGVSGLAFSRDVPVVTALTQGCAPISERHVITSCEDHVIKTINGRRAFDVFSEDLRNFAGSITGVPVQDVTFASEIEDDPMDHDPISLDSTVPEDIQKGDVHVAFGVSGSDMNDYLVRDVLGVDTNTGWIAVGHNVTEGESVMFVHRNHKTVKTDLARMLVDIRARVQKDHGEFAPRGALYFSCLSRAFIDADEMSDQYEKEIELIEQVLGDIPLVGFYANGEISNRHLYGHTGVLLLFL